MPRTPARRRSIARTASAPRPSAESPFTKSWGDVTHAVAAGFERAFNAAEIAHNAEHEDDPRDVSTAEAISGRVVIDGESRHLNVRRGFRRRGVIASYADDITLFLDAKSWPLFVALVNDLDERIHAVCARNPE